MRDIDNKHYVDGSRIYKKQTGEPIPEDEPLFLIRARDVLALPLLRTYREFSVLYDCNDWHFNNLMDVIQRFIKFKKDHPELMKKPSISMNR